jgi:hypothetical protein
MIVALAWGAWGGPVDESDAVMGGILARFTPREQPVVMEYDVGYRFLNIELSHVGKIESTTTIGLWQHRVSGRDCPALLVDVRVDSPDGGRAGRRNRVSIHDRMVAVLSLPDMQALVFSKQTDEFLNPLIGRAKVTRSISVYDVQSGRVDYEQRDFMRGVVSTNLANPEALLEVSRRIRPVLEHLVDRCRAGGSDDGSAEKARIGVNMDGRVVALRFRTEAERSPGCFGRRRLPAVRVDTVAERGSAVKPRDFHAWSMGFAELARQVGDPALERAAREAPVQSVVPLVIDYELGLGSVRSSMTAIRVAGASASRVAEGPEAVGEEHGAGDKALGEQLGQGRAQAKAAVEEPYQAR